MKKIKVGVMGTGTLGRHHARLYKRCSRAKLVGIYDLNEEQAEKVADEIGATVFRDPDALAHSVDALSLAVPTNRHFEVAKTMLEMGKHLLIEKPITETLEQARELLELARHRQLLVQVGHVERFNPVISYLETKANDPRFIECHRLSPYPPPRPGLPPRGTEVSVVLDLMIHDIDMVLHLVKSPIDSIEAVGIPVLSPTYDICNAHIKFENGCIANLTASRMTPEPLRKIRVFQNNCYFSLDYMKKEGQIFFKQGPLIRNQAIPVEDHNALLKQLEHFIECVAELCETGEAPLPKVSGRLGLRALEVAKHIADAARQAELTGQATREKTEV